MRISRLFILVTGLLAILLLSQCSDNTMEDNPLIDDSTFSIIQTKIFNKNCTTCHQEGTTFARQSNLILTEGKSYAQLVNRSPNNSSAKADGLVLVGDKGLESIYNSFLWEKINFPDYAHFYDDHPEYGELMPLGGRSLTNGELRFINEWIIAGAPETGSVVDENRFLDQDRFEIPTGEFEQLDPPQSGIQLSLGPFDIPRQREREFFNYQELWNQTDIFVNRVEVTMREGSHHFILYDYPEGPTPPLWEYRDFYRSDGTFNTSTAISILNQRFVFGTQWRNIDYSFPPGVALKIPANAAFDLNSHYVNRTDEIKQGEVSVNLHTVDKSEVQFVAENLFENYQDIFLPAGDITTLERVSTFNDRRHIFQLTSHAHQHMTDFEIYIEGGSRDSELVYYANDWEHPPLVTFDPPITLEKGQGLRARATYYNDTNKDLQFGLLSEDEMMIVFGAFYRD